MRIPFFRIFYSTTFTVLSIVLFVLVLITPANLVYEAFRRKEIYDIFIVSGVFVLTLIVAVLLYASRLYNNRRNLVHIPSDWSPLDAEKKVRKLVEEKLEYAAGVAYRCKPRDLSKDVDNKDAPPRPSQPALPSPNNTQPRRREEVIAVVPLWGFISHPGWSSPSSPDLPDIQFETIIRELPNLIEAKAVSLAPSTSPSLPYIPPSPSPSFPHPPPAPSPQPSQPPQTHPSSFSPPPNAPDSEPDPNFLSLLQRPATMGLRDYITHLSALGMLDCPSLTSRFLRLYEQARFSGQPLGESEFRELMGMFAEILRGMRGVEGGIVVGVGGMGEGEGEGEGEEGSVYPASSAAASSVHDGRGGDVRGVGGKVGDAEERLSFESDNSGETVMHTPLPDPDTSPPQMYYKMDRDREREWSSEGSARTAPERAGSLVSRGSEGSVIRVEGMRRELDLPFLDV